MAGLAQRVAYQLVRLSCEPGQQPACYALLLGGLEHVSVLVHASRLVRAIYQPKCRLVRLRIERVTRMTAQVVQLLEYELIRELPWGGVCLCILGSLRRASLAALLRGRYQLVVVCLFNEEHEELLRCDMLL